MTLQALQAPRFVRRTRLGPNEYRKNFHQIDREVLAAVTSEEADRVTLLMSKVYLRLVNAPDRFWEREGVLRIEAEERGDRLVKAWAVLCELVGVSSATASKALRWMHEQGIIGYFSGKNGVGLRIFLNRAVSSIGVRLAGKKFLAFPPASSSGWAASADEAAFSDSFAVLETLDTDKNPRAPKNGADAERVNETLSKRAPPFPADCRPPTPPPHISHRHEPESLLLESVITRLRAEIEPAMREATRLAVAREHERTREWLENRGLPKAARVAQHETYNVLRKYGVVGESSRSLRTQSGGGQNSYTPPDPHRLSDEEVSELAQVCVAMRETQGRSVEVTLAGMSSEAGGFLLPEDAGRVLGKARSLLSAGDGGGERQELPCLRDQTPSHSGRACVPGGAAVVELVAALSGERGSNQAVASSDAGQMKKQGQ